MRKRCGRRWAVLVTVVTALVVASCEKAADRSDGADASVDIGSNADVSSLPRGFRYPGARVQRRTTPEGVLYVFLTSDPVAKAVAYYDRPIEGFTRTNKSVLPAGTFFQFQSASGQEYMVAIMGNGITTMVEVVEAK